MAELLPLEVQDFWSKRISRLQESSRRIQVFILADIVTAFACLIKKNIYTSSLNLYLDNGSCSFFDNNVKINVFIIISHKTLQDFLRKPSEGDFDNKVE